MSMPVCLADSSRRPCAGTVIVVPGPRKRRWLVARRGSSSKSWVSNQWISVRFVSATGPEHAKAARRARRTAGESDAPAGAGRRRRARGLHAYGDGRRQVAVWSPAARGAGCEPARSSRLMPRPLHDRHAQPRVVGAVETARTAGSATASISIPPAIGGVRARRGVGGPLALPNARAGCQAGNPLSYSERSGRRYPRSALTTSPLLLSFVSSVLTVPVAMPVAFAISEAVIGPSLSASSTLALFCPRGARAGALVREAAPAGFSRALARAAGRAPPPPPAARDRAPPAGLARAGGSARRPGSLAPPAHPRARRPFEPAERVAQPFELLTQALVLRKLTLDLLDPRLHRLDDRAHIRDWRHLAPGFGVRAPS